MLRNLQEIDEKDVPWRTLHTFAYLRRATKYPWGRMEVGDAFKWPHNIAPASMQKACDRAGYRLGRTFVTISMGKFWYCYRIENLVDGTKWRDKVKLLDERTNTRYPWDVIKVGQSFRWPDAVTPHSRRTQAKAAGKRYGKTFVVQGVVCRRIA